MKITPTSSRMYGFMMLYEMHTDFLLRALAGIDQKDAQKRLNTKANHIAWITGSVVHSRFNGNNRVQRMDVKLTKISR